MKTAHIKNYFFPTNRYGIRLYACIMHPSIYYKEDGEVIMLAVDSNQSTPR